MSNELRELLKLVPTKQHGIFKALLSHTEVVLVDKRGEDWCYCNSMDHLFLTSEYKPGFTYLLEDFPHHLSKKMWVFGNTIIFVENKGPNGWLKSKVTLLSKDLGSVYYEVIKK